MADLKKPFVVSIVFCTLLLSCTMRVPCDNGNIKLCFVSFSDTATNSIILRQFKKSSDFKFLVDTILIARTNSSYKKYNDSLKIEYSFNFKNGYTNSKHGLTSEYDYEVYLPYINKIFQISDIDEEYKMQTKGFASDTSRCKSLIKAYSVNGKKIIGDFTDLTIYFHY